MRGTELASLKITNSWSSLRNFFIIKGAVITLTEYNKSQAVTETPTVVARYLPPSVSRLYISYVADVLPFLELLHFDSGVSPSTPPSPLIWHNEGTPWTTSQISNIMARETIRGVNCRLTAASWRDIAISIDQELLQELSTKLLNDESSSAYTAKAGHSRTVETHHYALSIDMVQGTSHRSLRLFKQVSDAWHALFALNKPAPPPLSSPCKRLPRSKRKPSVETRSTMSYPFGPLLSNRSLCSIPGHVPKLFWPLST